MKPGDAIIHNSRECVLVDVNHIGCRIRYDDDDSVKFIPRAKFHAIELVGIVPAPQVENKLPVIEQENSAPQTKYRFPLCVKKKNSAQLRSQCEGAAKLSTADVVEIRTLAAGGIPNVEIAEKFRDKVHRTTIYDIIKGSTWRYIVIDKESVELKKLAPNPLIGPGVEKRLLEIIAYIRAHTNATKKEISAAVGLANCSHYLSILRRMGYITPAYGTKKSNGTPIAYWRLSE